MRRYAFYLAVAVLAFLTGSFTLMLSYLKTDLDVNAVEDPIVRDAKYVNKIINEIESENTGFDELINARDEELITVGGLIDEKFLCPDADFQTDICTIVLNGNSSREKSLLVRLQMCKDGNKSNCVALKPNNRCAKVYPDQIKIYDNDSKVTEWVEEIKFSDGRRYNYRKGFQLKVKGRVSVTDGKPRILTPIEKLEIIEIR